MGWQLPVVPHVGEGCEAHDVAQHTPATQKPLAHCVGTVQEAPRFPPPPVVVVVVELATVVVVVATISGAQTIFCALGVS